MPVVRVRRSLVPSGMSAFAAGGVGAPPATDAAGSSASSGGSDWRFVLGSVAAVFLYWLLFVALQIADPLKPHAAATVAAGVSVFALFYISAQAIERLLEPFASLDPVKKRLVKVRDAANAKAIADGGAGGTADLAAEAQAALETWRANRAAVLWASATILGMAASALLGTYFLAAILVGSTAPMELDILVTGLAIGGGTKPLHDLISRIESSAARVQDSTTDLT
jgi:hypothetical protein